MVLQHFGKMLFCCCLLCLVGVLYVFYCGQYIFEFSEQNRDVIPSTALGTSAHQHACSKAVITERDVGAVNS